MLMERAIKSTGLKLPAQENWINPLMNWRLWISPISMAFFLIAIAQYSFLAFHTLAELFTIIISFVMFAFAWSTRHFSRNNFLLFLACGYFWIGSLDLMHTLVYKGMNVFIEGNGNLAVQFWIGTRYFEGLLLLAAPFVVTKKHNGYLLMTVFGGVAVGIVTLIMSGAFPTGFVEGKGLTDFKVYSEYLIDLILVLALIALFYVGRTISSRERIIIAASIILTMCAELAFTFYISVYGLSNLVGHILKLFSFWLIFHAIIVSNLRKPYTTLRESEESFKRLFENSEVSIWNEDFSQVSNALDKLHQEGVRDLEQYLKQNEQVALDMMAMIKVILVNEATLKLFAAKTKDDFYRQMKIPFGPDALDVFIKVLCAIWEKKKTFRSEATYRTLDGKEISAIISFQIPETKDGFRSIPVSIIDITKRKQDEERIWRQANFDALTGLANRNLFFDRLSHALDLAERSQKRVALVSIDLDRFKYVNDTLGHSIGDKLLQEASQRLISNMRKSDTVARLGGDEFAIMLPENNALHDIEDSVSKILKTLAQRYCLEGNDAFVSASIGITVFPDDGSNAATLLRKADSAMYRAKDRGRNNYQFFTAEIDVEAQQRRELEKALHIALENQEFSVNYQPIIDLDTGFIDSAEALIRWNHPEKGIVSPMEFIPLAEEIGLIVPIGEWVLREACREAMSWSKITKAPPGIAVNLSSTQFQRQSIPDLVKSVLVDTGLPAERLTLEITESLLVADDDKTLSQLQEIRNLGVCLSIDDFGTGYSSLSYLKKFPVTTLKIDRSFITDLPKNPEDVALVKAILSMTQSLNLKVIAEGVETAEQVEFLKSRQCQYTQGYLYSRPLPKVDLTDYLRKHQSRVGAPLF